MECVVRPQASQFQKCVSDSDSMHGSHPSYFHQPALPQPLLSSSHLLIHHHQNGIPSSPKVKGPKSFLVTNQYAIDMDPATIKRAMCSSTPHQIEPTPSCCSLFSTLADTQSQCGDFTSVITKIFVLAHIQAL